LNRRLEWKSSFRGDLEESSELLLDAVLRPIRLNIG
jgi:hypothetical protein